MVLRGVNRAHNAAFGCHMSNKEELPVEMHSHAGKTISLKHARLRVCKACHCWRLPARAPCTVIRAYLPLSSSSIAAVESL